MGPGGMFLGGVARCLAAAAASHKVFKEKTPRVASPLGTTTPGCSARGETFMESPVTAAWIQQIFPLRKTPWEPAGLSMPQCGQAGGCASRGTQAPRRARDSGRLATRLPGHPCSTRNAPQREKKKKEIPFGALLGVKPHYFEWKRQLQHGLGSLEGPALPLLSPRRRHRLPP